MTMSKISYNVLRSNRHSQIVESLGKCLIMFSGLQSAGVRVQQHWRSHNGHKGGSGDINNFAPAVVARGTVVRATGS